jgi:putative N6-adenine-specific DNA methylase
LRIYLTQNRIMSDQPRYDLFAVCQPGLEKIVADELRTLGIANPQPVHGGVEFRGFSPRLSRQLWSRTVERVLLRLREFRADSFRGRITRPRAPRGRILKPGCEVSIRATCRKSILMHTGGVADASSTVFRSLGTALSVDYDR